MLELLMVLAIVAVMKVGIVAGRHRRPRRQIAPPRQRLDLDDAEAVARWLKLPEHEQIRQLYGDGDGAPADRR